MAGVGDGHEHGEPEVVMRRRMRIRMCMMEVLGGRLEQSASLSDG